MKKGIPVVKAKALGAVSIAPLLLLVFLLSPFASGGESGPEEIFFRANLAYKEGRFREAIEGYTQLLRAGHEGGHIYYNLGNAYLREKELGRAILNYERARLLIPRDQDLNFNLRYALDQTRDAIPVSRGFIGQTFFWLHGMTLAELLWGFALLNALFWGLLVLRLFVRAEWTYYAFLLLLIFWLIGGLSFALKWYALSSDDRAVVLEKEVNVLAGPESRDTILFRLHQGAVVQEERSEERWTLIRLPDGKRGWVRAESAERILKTNLESP